MFSIDVRSRVPLYLQIVQQVEILAARGILPAHEQLPSVRGLAVMLSLNPNTVSRAYGELEEKGIIYAQLGKGMYVAERSESLMQQLHRLVGGKLRGLAKDAASYGADNGMWLDLCRTAWQEGNGKEGVSFD